MGSLRCQSVMHSQSAHLSRSDHLLKPHSFPNRTRFSARQSLRLTWHAASGFYRSSEGKNQCGRHRHARCQLASDGALEHSDIGSAPLSEGLSWERLTQRLVSGATLVFFFLLVPQIVKNASNLLRGDTAALIAVAWVRLYYDEDLLALLWGYLTALLGNVMLLNYFLKKREDGGALVQAVGAATNVVVLTQTYLAGTMPGTIYVATAALVACTTLFCGLKRQGFLESGPAAKAWHAWDDFLGLVGVSSLAQASASTFADVQCKLPGALGLGAAATLLTLDRTERMPESCRGLWTGVPAWSATFLFAFQPIAQLVTNFTVPSSLGGLSKATVLLAMIGNGLMVPRALLTRDKVWLAGSAWACFTGWFQLFSLFQNRDTAGLRYLGSRGFLAATALYLTYNLLILRKDMQAKSLPVTPLSLPKLLSHEVF